MKKKDIVKLKKELERVKGGDVLHLIWFSDLGTLHVCYRRIKSGDWGLHTIPSAGFGGRPFKLMTWIKKREMWKYISSLADDRDIRWMNVWMELIERPFIEIQWKGGVGK